VQALRQAGYVPGVISRGYGAKSSAENGAESSTITREVLSTSTAAEVGDEPLLIAYRGGCPVMVGRNRVAAAQALLQAHPEINVLVSDDGLQHYALQRDVEIVLFDGRGVGNGWLLPAGPLREAISRSRDFTVVNIVPTAPIPLSLPSTSVRMQLVGEFAERLNDATQLQPLSALQQSTKQQPSILAAAGIGNPQRFFTMLTSHQLTFTSLALPDHYDFSDNPFAASNAEIILITEKDAVKCRQIPTIQNDPRIWVVPVTAQIDDLLAQHIMEKLRGHKIA
ncbi:MAG: tetraacyldisaccharide 4'-kinase, partial [Glaciimonas sp.]|nr:tetraacyldisaccharide 4'-kinase [Glaciimonas sp.]